MWQFFLHIKSFFFYFTTYKTIVQAIYMAQHVNKTSGVCLLRHSAFGKTQLPSSRLKLVIGIVYFNVFLFKNYTVKKIKIFFYYQN